ncbi:MAG: MopE-related protein [Myxococcota bacterium]
MTLVFLGLAACPGDSGVKVYNEEPIANIISPPDGTSVNEAEAVTFEGRVSDNATASNELAIRWASDVDGEIGTDAASADGVVLLTTASLSVGNHAITLSATDEDGALAQSAAIVITVVDVPDNPTIVLHSPTGGQSGVEEEPFEFLVEVSDSQQAPETLTVSFESDLDGTFCTPTADARGFASCEQALSAGTHHLSFVVEDADGLRGVEEYYFTVIALTAVDDDGDGFTEEQGDCNDADGSVYPTATEYYNGRDEDCDGVIDDGTEGYDDDGDGMNEIEGDCDDDDAVIYEAATEVCDSKDNDCDSISDETTECYDDDGDGLAEIAGDCDDADPSSEPGAPELEDGADNDCDGTTDEGTNAYDDDGDGYTENAGDCDDASYSISPAATETCDYADNDCDGNTDEVNASGCTTYYYDYDGDGYGTSRTASQCLCTSGSGYTSTNDDDCYDYNSSANPAHTTYHTSSRGDGSYDYNCDSSETKAYSSTASCTYTVGDCEPTRTGYYSSAPSCGSSGTYLDHDDDCDWSWSSWSCEVGGASTVTQSCL